VAMRARRSVESMPCEQKCRHHMDRMRYDGRARAAIQAYLTAIVVDVKKMARRLAKKSAPATSPAARSAATSTPTVYRTAPKARSAKKMPQT
jgi:hypothetical protein